MINNAIEMHNKEHIITLMWHSCFPSDGDSFGMESIWVWNANAPRSIPGDESYSYKDYFPGIEYVDVLAVDVFITIINKAIMMSY